MLLKYQIWVRCPRCRKKFMTETVESECPFCGAKFEIEVSVNIKEVGKRLGRPKLD
ncbi:MAG: hypothetical protein QXR68_08020 [Pyrobaculum sp.]